jgi:hypothetical protein
MTILGNNPSTGLGPLTRVPTGRANGTPFPPAPEGTYGARLYLNPGDSVTFTVCDDQPTSPPAATFTASATDTGPNWDEALSAGQTIYVTTTTGNPSFRWY